MEKKSIMKKSFSICVCVLLVLTFIFATAVLSGCKDEKTPPDDATVVSISLDTTNVKTTFAYGETFSYDNLKVTAAMSDETTKDIPIADCIVSSPNMTAPGTRNVTVTYSGKTARYEITVSEKYMPTIDGASLLDITGENEDVGYRVEAEDINMAVSEVTPKSGTGFVKTASGTSVTSGGKYLGNFGVTGNYFGFTFTADKAYSDVILVLRMAYGGSSNLPLGSSVKMYLNYKSLSDTGEIDISGKTVEVGETADECGWQDIVVRAVAVPAGTNKLTFEVLSAEVPNIDYIDFYVGKRYISSVVEVSEKTTYTKEFEHFDLEKIVNRQDMIDAHGLQPGECYVEWATTNLEGTSGRQSAAGFTTGTEVSTTIRCAEDATVKIIIVAANVSSYKIKDTWEFYIDGELLTDVEDKDIKAGSAEGSYYWEWRDTSLGKYDLAAGDHLFTAKVTGGHCNVDIFKFEVVSYGGFAVESVLSSIAVTTAPAKTAYTIGESFDPAGMVVTAAYEDGSTEAVTGYTVSPGGALALSDTSVTISYTKGEITKTATQSITVTEAPAATADITVSEAKEYVMEAEDCDLSDCVPQENAPSIKIETPPADSNTSGSRSLGAIGVGSTITVSIATEEKATVKIYARMAKYEGGSAATYASFTFDGEAIDLGDATLNPGYGDTTATMFFNWSDIYCGTYDIIPGEYDFVFTTPTGAINLDCFKFDVISYGEFAEPDPEPVTPDVNITGIGTYVMEGEDLDPSEVIGRSDMQVPDGTVKFEDSASASGGQCIAGFAPGSKFTVTVNAEEDCTVEIFAVMAKYEGGAISSYATFTLDGETLTTTAEIPAGYAGSNETMYYNWSNASLGSVNLTAGSHSFVITMSGTGCPNIDCFKFVVSAYGV